MANIKLATTKVSDKKSVEKTMTDSEEKLQTISSVSETSQKQDNSVAQSSPASAQSLAKNQAIMTAIAQIEKQFGKANIDRIRNAK